MHTRLNAHLTSIFLIVLFINATAMARRHTKSPKRIIIIKYTQTKSALIYDSVYVFAIALQALEQSHKLRISNVSCLAETPWNGGLSLVNYINGVS